MEAFMAGIPEVGTGRVRAANSRKVYALAIVVVVLVGVIGFMFYAYGGLPGVESVNNPQQASDTLSDVGNDLSGITDDLKGIENLL